MEKEDLERQLEDTNQQSVKLDTLKQTVEKLQSRLYERKLNESSNITMAAPEETLNDEAPLSHYEEVHMAI